MVRKSKVPESIYDVPENGLQLAQVFSLKCLVDYSPGAVVSRIIQETEGGNITVFAFADGQGLSEHSAPYDAVVQILDGTAEVTIDGVPHELSKGRIIIMPANVPHALRAVTRFKMMLTMIRKG